MNKSGNVAVVYLAWVPYGPDQLRLFLASYLQHPAGAVHELYIIFNGVHQESDLDSYLAILKEQKVSFRQIVRRSGQDIEAYRDAAAQIDATYILFLNTYSRLLSDRWLAQYITAIQQPGVGLVGATGSWQSYSSTVYHIHTWRWEGEKGFSHNYRKYKLFLKAFFYWSFFFRSFPNPHIRSNAFMLRREDFLSLKIPSLHNKFQAYRFESGRNGMTNQLLKKKKQAVVIDRIGRQYTADQWKTARLFWIDQQENLLVEDNQTQKYATGDQAAQAKLTYLAWGE